VVLSSRTRSSLCSTPSARLPDSPVKASSQAGERECVFTWLMIVMDDMPFAPFTGWATCISSCADTVRGVTKYVANDDS
jgi:hypothetical protein